MNNGLSRQIQPVEPSLHSQRLADFSNCPSYVPYLVKHSSLCHPSVLALPRSKPQIHWHHVELSFPSLMPCICQTSLGLLYQQSD